MKKALIDGVRIAQIADAAFPVAAPLRWVDVPDDATTHDRVEGGLFVRVERIQVPAPGPTVHEKLEAVIDELASKPGASERIKALAGRR
jgi:hypothetical protein